MYLLDTDVLSALRRGRRNRNVVAWISTVSAADLFLSAVTIGVNLASRVSACSIRALPRISLIGST